jgi:hypothetical protein
MVEKMSMVKHRASSKTMHGQNLSMVEKTEHGQKPSMVEKNRAWLKKPSMVKI